MTQYTHTNGSNNGTVQHNNGTGLNGTHSNGSSEQGINEGSSPFDRLPFKLPFWGTGADDRDSWIGGGGPDENDERTLSHSRTYAQIIGWGSYVPEKIIRNQDLEQIVDTSDEWIRSRTGIEERRVVVDPKETTATMSIKAAREALAVADVPANKVDLVICATSSAEHIFPSTASIIQDALGAVNAGAFDLAAACSGFVYALSMARGHILAGDAEYVLVIGAETMSRLVDWTDRNTCVLFGDGAAAVLVAASEVPGGITAVELGSDGSGANSLVIPAGGSAMPANLETVSTGSHFIRMDGKAVFRFATRTIANSTRRVVAKAGLELDDIDMIIPHQANSRIIQNSIQKQLKMPEEKVFVNVQKYGNTSAASIPLALCEAIEQGKIKPDDNLVFIGFGAGLTWASCTVKWCVPVDNAGRRNWWFNTRQAAGYQAAAVRSVLRRAARWVSGTLLADPHGRPPRAQSPANVRREAIENARTESAHSEDVNEQ